VDRHAATGPEVLEREGRPAAAVAKAQNLLRDSPVTGPGYTMVAKIEARGSDQVVFTTTKPWTNFPTLLATQVGVIADPDWIASNDGLHPVGTGPFRLESWSVDNQLVVVKNPDYWRSDSRGNRYPYLDRITFRIMTDGNSRASAIESGDIDLAELIEPSVIRSFQAKGDTFQLFTNSDSEMTEYFVLLNTQVAPFDDIDARRALAYATDRQAIVDTVEAGLFETANGPFATNSPWYDPQNGYPDYNPAKAKELVDAVKARHGGSFSITIQGPTNGDATVTLQQLQQMYQDVGIDVKVQTVEPATTIITAVTGNYQAMFFGGWFYPHPDQEMAFIDPRTAAAPPTFTLNLSRNADPDLAPMIDAWRAASAPADQKKAMDAIVRRINEDSAYIWLFHAQVGVVANRHLVNLTNYTLPDGQKGLDLREGSHPLFQVWIKG
jgi:peptide/nickel transport system substrate-binding protein